MASARYCSISTSPFSCSWTTFPSIVQSSSLLLFITTFYGVGPTFETVMKRLRKIIFWCHLPVGVVAGLVILNMCVTGVLLTYEKQITSWADTRGYRSAPPSPESRRLPVETLIANAAETRGATPTAVTLKSDPSAPAEVAFGREASSLFVNPYSGQVLGEGSQRVRSFFRGVTEWHRWLGAKGDNRNVARAITGACNLGFLFLVMSGFYLWWPRNWNLKALR